MGEECTDSGLDYSQQELLTVKSSQILGLIPLSFPVLLSLFPILGLFIIV